jgi:hypothetical protein
MRRQRKGVGQERVTKLARNRGKLVFDKTPPATIDIYNRSKLFLAWDGDPSILRSFRLSCWFEPHSHVINSIMQEQEADPQLKATLAVDWMRPTRTEAEGLRWLTLFLLTQLRKKYPYVTSWFLSRRVARAQPKAAL